jgi:hypothetical protein
MTLKNWNQKLNLFIAIGSIPGQEPNNLLLQKRRGVVASLQNWNRHQNSIIQPNADL